MPAIHRLIDANANRAREALRTLEDTARFVIERADLAETAKTLRHELRDAIEDPSMLLASRDTPGDVGTHITHESEMARADISAVAIAAGKRLGEALRCLEEFGKTVPGVDVAAIKQLRYRSYDLEQRLNTALKPGTAQQWRLCLLLTQSLCRHRWEDVLDQALAAGVDCIQIREKAMEAGPLLTHTRAVIKQTRAEANASTAVSVIVNDRPDVALASGAHGVHLGQDDVPVSDVRRLLGRQLLVGISTHTPEQATTAKRDGADYCGIGPMYSSSTKPRDFVAGPDAIRTYAKACDLPHLAIGGITPDRVPELRAAGCRGIAVSGAICEADDPAAMCRALLAGLED